MDNVRVIIKLTPKTAPSKKCYVVIKPKWKLIRDLEDHLKQLFHLDSLELYVDDCWLPSDETINVIHPTDVICAKEISQETTTPCSTDVKGGTKKKEAIQQKVSDNDKHDSDPQIDRDQEQDHEIASRKEKLLKKVETWEHEEMDVTDNSNYPSLKKRKRKRKHKPKQKYSTEPLNEEQVDRSSREVSKTQNSRSHIRFEAESELTGSEQVVENQLEDWQERLLNMAAQNDKPVFSRQPNCNGSQQDVDVPMTREEAFTEVSNGECTANGVETTTEETSALKSSIPMESAKTSDLMYFKILVVENGAPTVSSHILSLVEDIDVEQNVLTLKILDKQLQLDEVFSCEDIQNADDTSIVKISWNRIIEPLLVVDPKLISKYL